MANKLIVEVLGDTRSYERAMHRSSKATKGFEDHVSRMGAALKGLAKTAGFAAAALGAAGLAAVIHEGTKELRERQKVEAQAAAALKSTGDVANTSMKQMDALALSLSNLSGVDDEVVKSAETMLLSFTNVRNEVGKGNDIFNRATKDILDFAVRTGRDAPSAAILLGKALEDPANKVSALARAGIVFSASQKKVIADLVKSGRTLDAQKLILAELEKRYQGAAKAAGDTLGGRLNILRERFKDLSGDLLTLLLPALNKVVSGLTTVLRVVNSQFAGIKRVATPAIASLTQAIQGAFGPIRTFVLPIVRDLGEIVRNTFNNVAGVIRSNSADLKTILSNLGIALKNVWAIGGPLIVFLFEKALPAALRVVIPILKLTTGLTKVMAEAFTKAVSIILKAIDKFLGGISFLSDALSHLPGIGDKFKGVSDKVNAVRESLQGMAGDLDKLNGKQVDVFVNVKTVRDRGEPRRSRTRKPAPRTLSIAPVVTVETPEERAARIKAENEAAKQAAANAAAAIKKRNEAIAAAVKSAQFRGLGLTGTGDKPTPGTGSLLNRVQALQRHIQGTVLDTPKINSQLRRIVKVLKGKFGKAGKDVREAILGMLNDISSAFAGRKKGGGGGGAAGPLTKTHGLNTKKLVQGLGLTPQAERELRGRLSHFNTAGRALGGSATNAPGGSRVPGQRGPSEPSFVANVNVYIDGKKVSNTVTKQQQKDRRRNPPQKRGPHSGHR